MLPPYKCVAARRARNFRKNFRPERTSHFPEGTERKCGGSVGGPPRRKGELNCSSALLSSSHTSSFVPAT